MAMKIVTSFATVLVATGITKPKTDRKKADDELSNFLLGAKAVPFLAHDVADVDIDMNKDTVIPDPHKMF